MGCQHDRANATSFPVLTYAFGFQDPAGDFRTVMGVAEGCPGACSRIAHFANPDVNYSGVPTGISLAEPEAAACAIAIDETSPVTANFRTLVAPSDVTVSTTLTDRVSLSFSHPWPWSFQVYRAPSGEPMAPLETIGGSPYSDASAIPGASYDYWISTLTAPGEESAIVGPVGGLRAIPLCGNGSTESPAEECDDGALAAGDGCDADCQSETPLDSDDGLCITTINNRVGRVAKAQGKENLACAAAAAAGTESDADGCLVADEKGKVMRASEKTIEADARFCLAPPPFGYAGGSAAAFAGEYERRAWLGDLLGEDVSAAVVAKSMDDAGAACQRAVAKSADRLLTSYLASFTRCVKERIDDNAVFATESLEACFDTVAADALATNSHITMNITRLRQARIKNCSGMDLSVLFPGNCGTLTDTAFDACMSVAAACRTCLLFTAADALERDCDLYDNGAADSSCLP